MNKSWAVPLVVCNRRIDVGVVTDLKVVVIRMRKLLGRQYTPFVNAGGFWLAVYFEAGDGDGSGPLAPPTPRVDDMRM